MHMMNSRAQIWVPVIPENCCFVVLQRKTSSRCFLETSSPLGASGGEAFNVCWYVSIFEVSTLSTIGPLLKHGDSQPDQVP